MSDPERGWRAVDAYLAGLLVREDEALMAARASGEQTTMPHAEVTPNQGRLLALIVQLMGAQRVLEFGTLAGYSTIWLARAVGETGHVDTLELEPQNAAVARANLGRAGVEDRVEILVGPARESAGRLIDEERPPYDFVFIDADKPSNPDYLEAALLLTRPGSVIVIDNVVRGGAVIRADSADPRVHGVRTMLAAIAADDRLDATALQTVGAKGWDGFAVVRRV